MAIIPDQAKKGLPLEGLSSLADMSADIADINPNVLFFMANIPAKYLAMLGGSGAIQTNKIHQQEKEKKEITNDRLLQQEIDRNMIRLQINGVDVDISQGDLRKAMQTRVEELKQRRLELERNGGSAKEIYRLDHLIDEYNPVIDDLKNHKADAATKEATQDLLRQDPDFGNVLQKTQRNEKVLTADKSNSFSATAFDDGTIVAPSLKSAFGQGASLTPPPQPAAVISLKDTFAQGASLAVQSPATVPPPVLDKRQQNINNAFTSMGI